MKEITLDELPKYSPWPARLLGDAEFHSEKRTLKKILREYDSEKFWSYLSFLRKHPHSSISDIRWVERGTQRDAKICISQNGALFLERADKAFALRDRLFLAAVKPYMSTCDTVIELGAGFGYNLSLLRSVYKKHELLGGEVSANGIRLAKEVLAGKDVSMSPFNFYDKKWEIFNSTKSVRILVLTSHASEMLPKAKLLVDGLSRYKDRIATVVQLEPIYQLTGTETGLDLMRRAYIRMNDYNKDHLSALERKDVLIHKKSYDYFGSNPLFPESLIVWNFAKV